MTNQPRILIVDDEPTIQQLLKLTFRSRPWHVEAVCSGSAAIEACRKQPFDLILLDKNLDDLSGTEVLRTLRDMGDEVSCIMMTAFSSVKSAVEMMSLNVDGYLEKPFDDIEAIAQRVADTLRQKGEGQRISKSSTAARNHFRAAQRALAAASISQPQPGGLAIVIACPDPRDRNFLTPKFTHDLVQLCESDADLFKRLDGGKSDLLIVDGTMATGTLTAFVHEIRRLAPEPGLLLLTKRLPLREVTALIDAGVDVLLERPLSDSAFHRNCDRLLRRLRHSAV